MDEMFWRLFGMTFLVWLFSDRLFSKTPQERVFQVVLALQVLVYMAMQFNMYATLVGEVTPFVVAQIVLVSGGFIAAAGWSYRQGGFLAPVTMHLTQYMLYHGLYGGLRVL